MGQSAVSVASQELTPLVQGPFRDRKSKRSKHNAESQHLNFRLR